MDLLILLSLNLVGLVGAVMSAKVLNQDDFLKVKVIAHQPVIAGLLTYNGGN